MSSQENAPNGPEAAPALDAEALPAPGSSPHDPTVDAAAFRWMRPLAIAAIAVVVAGAFNTHPAPGLRGDHAVVSVALIAFAAGTITVVQLREAPSTVLLPLTAVVVLAAATLVGLQPDGPGFLGVFPAVCVAALRLPTRAAAAVAGLAVAALAAASTVGSWGLEPGAGSASEVTAKQYDRRRSYVPAPRMGRAGDPFPPVGGDAPP